MTPLSFVTAEPDGRVAYAFRNEGAADHDLADADVPLALPEAVACLALGSYSIALEPTGGSLVALAEREHDRRVVSFDPNVRTDLMPDKAVWLSRFERLLRVSTIVKMSREDIELAFGSQQSANDLAERALQRGVRLFVVTDGAGPTLGFTASGTVSVDAIPVPVVDTVGAGDGFHAGLLAWLARHGRLDRGSLSTLGSECVRDAMDFANRCAAFACSRAGADLPRLADVETIRHEGN